MWLIIRSSMAANRRRVMLVVLASFLAATLSSSGRLAQAALRPAARAEKSLVADAADIGRFSRAQCRAIESADEAGLPLRSLLRGKGKLSQKSPAITHSMSGAASSGTPFAPYCSHLRASSVATEDTIILYCRLLI